MNKLLQFKRNKIVMAIMLGCSFVSYNSYAQTKPANTSTEIPKETKVNAYEGTTFDKIKNSGKISIGFRGAAIPLSYYDANKKPVGYGIDICMNLVDKIKQKLNMNNLTVEFVETNPATRIPLVVSGEVDFECGATSSSEERRKQVAFTVPYYIDSVRILVKSNSNIVSIEDLRNKTVAFGKGTIAIPIVQKISKQRALGIKIKEVKNYVEGVEDIDKNSSVALITNALLLEGTRSSMPKPENYKVVGEFLSVEPTSIMFRKNDSEFSKFMNKEMVKLISSGQVENYYKKWFLSPIAPKNINLNIQPSPLLIDIFRNPTEIIGN